MITKILFTLAVIGSVVWLIRFRQRPRTVVVPQPAGKGGRMRVVALVFMVVMGGGALVVGYLRWQESHQVLEVRVIDAGSGRVSSYRVYRGELKDRGFRTVEGREVRLAETERVEVTAAP